MASGGEDDPSDPLYWQKFLAEAGANFEIEPSAPPSIDTLRQLYSSALSNYGYTCAMTGVCFDPPTDFLHEDLEIAAIRPLANGGALHVSNFLCLEFTAASAFRRGHIAIGKGFELIPDLSRIDPELLERLNPIGRLRLPEADIARPDPSALAFHRTSIFLAF